MGVCKELTTPVCSACMKIKTIYSDCDNKSECACPIEHVCEFNEDYNPCEQDCPSCRPASLTWTLKVAQSSNAWTSFQFATLVVNWSPSLSKPTVAQFTLAQVNAQQVSYKTSLMVAQSVVQVAKMKTNQTAEAVNQLEVTSELTDASNGHVTVWLNRNWCLVHSVKNSSIRKRLRMPSLQMSMSTMPTS